MNIILFDDERIEHFLPLTHTRPLAALRCGILTMQEKWQHTTTVPVYYLSRPASSGKIWFTNRAG
jgi:hypothetical protein